MNLPTLTHLLPTPSSPFLPHLLPSLPLLPLPPLPPLLLPSPAHVLRPGYGGGAPPMGVLAVIASRRNQVTRRRIRRGRKRSESRERSEQSERGSGESERERRVRHARVKAQVGRERGSVRV